jgi:hypothetical protein
MVNGHHFVKGNNDVYINNGEGSFKKIDNKELKEYAKIF